MPECFSTLALDHNNDSTSRGDWTSCFSISSIPFATSTRWQFSQHSELVLNSLSPASASYSLESLAERSSPTTCKAILLSRSSPSSRVFRLCSFPECESPSLFRTLKSVTDDLRCRSLFLSSSKPGHWVATAFFHLLTEIFLFVFLTSAFPSLSDDTSRIPLILHICHSGNGRAHVQPNEQTLALHDPSSSNSSQLRLSLYSPPDDDGCWMGLLVTPDDDRSDNGHSRVAKEVDERRRIDENSGQRALGCGMERLMGETAAGS